MSATGESYQRARGTLLLRARLRTSDTSDASDASDASGADLVAVRYFGIPANIATFTIAGRLSMMVVSSAHHHHHGPMPTRGPFFAMKHHGSVS